MSNPELIQAYADLESAMRRVFELKGNLRPDEIIPHWVMFGYVERPFERDEEDHGRYLMALPNGQQAVHITIGLLYSAIDLIGGGWTNDDEEDD